MDENTTHTNNEFEFVIENPIFPSEVDLVYPGEEIENAEFSLELDYLDDEKQEDQLWQARTGLSEETLCGAIETVIFMSDRPVPLNKIRSLIDPDLPLRVIHESLARLQGEYECAHHGLRLLEVAEGYQFRTKATFSKYVQDLFKVNSLVLSPTALEVLAIVAYKQPVSRVEIDKIRGVDSSHIVRGLMDRRLVKVSGRSEEMGRPVLYGTTPEFLEVFNLADLSQLPPEHELESLAVDDVGKITDIKNLVNSGDKEQFNFDEIGELDQLSQNIKSICADTPFTKSLKVEDKKRTSETGGEVKTAFELLEEHIVNKQVTDQNNESIDSELVSMALDPKVIQDLEAGPFNLPEEEEEEFEMIDLDTGLPFVEEEKEETTELLAGDLLSSGGDLEQEKEALANALDDAFAKLTGENLPNQELMNSDLSFEEQEVEEKSVDLEQLQEDMVEKAQEFDLDLSFLNDETENSEETPPPAE